MSVYRLAVLEKPERPFVKSAENDRSEPDSAIVILCCMRSQHESRCKGLVWDAAMQRRNEPFMPTAAYMRRARIKSRDDASLRCIHTNGRKPCIASGKFKYRQMRVGGTAIQLVK